MEVFLKEIMKKDDNRKEPEKQELKEQEIKIEEDSKVLDLLTDEFFYVMQFDTINILRKKLIKNFDSKTTYPIKGIDSRALLFIGLYPNKPMKFYSEKLNIEQGSFNYICNKIKSLGLVDIVIDENDKRMKKFVLTGTGEKEVLRSRLELNEHIENKLSVLSSDDKMKFFELLAEMRDILKLI